jgi:glycosyltransferase involved in cell wall biosynthesis
MVEIYEDFDWILYIDEYSLKNDIFDKESAWNYYLNTGKLSNHVYYNIHKRREFEMQRENFDWEKYLNTYENVKNSGIDGKYASWWHYNHKGKAEGYQYFQLPLTNLQENLPITTTTFKQLNIYYYVDHVINSDLRSGIQVLTIYIAKYLLKMNSNIVFVKWDNNNNNIIPCKTSEISHMFNYRNNGNIIEPIIYTNYNPIHINNDYPINNFLLFIPELTFSRGNFIEKIRDYIQHYSIKNMFILYDIIPIALQEYYDSSGQFRKYLTENLIRSNKIIAISNFTKLEFEKYCNKNGLSIPKISTILLPNQFRDSSRMIKDESCSYLDNDKVVILLPGTIEPRKQQILLMKIFLKFIHYNRSQNVELIVYGEIVENQKGVVQELIAKSRGKIKYLGLITDEEIRELYKKASFLCFISIYEGYGFPVSESLWNGVPVLTSNSGSMSEIAVSGGCHTINTRDKDEIYNALDKLIKEPQYLFHLREQIKQTSLSTWYQYTQCIYNELISN